MMVQGCVLIRVKKEKLKDVLGAVKGISGVKKVFPVFGRYDVVAFMEAENRQALLECAKKINAFDGTRSTETAIES